MPANQVTVGTSPTALGTVGAGETIVVQVTGTSEVFVSDETTAANLTTATGIALAPASGFAPGGTMTETYEPAPGDPQTLTWYGIVASGTSTVVVDVEA